MSDHDKNTTKSEKELIVKQSEKPDDDVAADTPIVQFRRVDGAKKNLKKRAHETSTNGDEDSLTITKKAKQGPVGLVDEAAASSSGVSILEGTSFGFSYESSGAKRLGPSDQGATQTNMQAVYGEEKRKATAVPNSLEAPDDNQVYVGQAGYTQYVKQSKYSGPVKSAANIRTDVRMDYARDICKDYKETGYCGYGDSCKFLHDRSDYKAGWQMEREWELEEKQKREARAQTFTRRSGAAGSSSSANVNGDDSFTEEGLKMSSKNSKDLPFACYICRKPFVDPVVTKCGHYFCQNCALQRHVLDKTCAVCKEPTNGSFNSALKILKRRDDIAKLAGKTGSS